MEWDFLNHVLEKVLQWDGDVGYVDASRHIILLC